MNKIKNAFGEIKADEQLKNNTLAFLDSKRSEPASRSRRKVIPYSLAAAAVLFLTIAAGVYEMWFVPVTVVSIDVNPSVEINVNRLDRIMSADAYNDDGAKILQSVSVEGMKYEDGINDILNSDEFTQYLSDDSLLTFTVASENEDKVISQIQHCLSTTGHQGVCVNASSEAVSQAHHLGLSLGKYQAYLEILEYDPTITAEECSSMTMKELCELKEQLSGEDTCDTVQGSGNQQGSESHGHGAEHQHGR